MSRESERERTNDKMRMECDKKKCFCFCVKAENYTLNFIEKLTSQTQKKEKKREDLSAFS